MMGCKKGMGQDWRPNKVISVQLMTELLGLAELKALRGVDLEERHKWIMAGGYFCLCFVLSLRSTEGNLADLKGMIEHFDESAPNVIIPLLGRFKGEDHSSRHLMPCSGLTDSGIAVKLWMRRVLAVHRSAGMTKGPFFISAVGIQPSTCEMNTLFVECLNDIFERRLALFGVDVRTFDDLSDKYHVFRSFCRGSESWAVAKKVLCEDDRYVANRWRRKEVTGASRVSHSIEQHYVDVTLVTASFLRYTKAM